MNLRSRPLDCMSPPPWSRVPPVALGPPLDGRGLPLWSDAVDPIRLGELAFGLHLRHSLMGDAEKLGNLTHAEDATPSQPAAVVPRSPALGGRSRRRP